MDDLLGKLEEKLRTIIKLRLKIEISQDLEPIEMKKFIQNESEYLDNAVVDILQDIEEDIDTCKLDICDIIQQDVDEAEYEENQFIN